MRARTKYAIAASLAGLAIAVPAALWTLSDRGYRSLYDSRGARTSGIFASGDDKGVVTGLAKRPAMDAPRVDVIRVPVKPVESSGPATAAPAQVAAAAPPTAPPMASPVGRHRTDLGRGATDHDQSQSFRFGAGTKFESKRADAPAKSKTVPGLIATGAMAPGEKADRIADLKAELDASSARKGNRQLADDGVRRAQEIRRELALLEEQKVRQREESRDRFASAEPYPFKSVALEPVSTFSVDVDTASYSLVRRSLNAGRLPPREAVRVEEMINYFAYAYPRPESASTPFQPTITVVPTPWNAESRLVHVALKGYALSAAERPRANLVLLIDVSGSMAPADRLPLLQRAFAMLVDELRPEDTIAIVTYASNTATRLSPTRVADKARILEVIDGLQAGGGTYGEGGLQRAYALAEASFDAAAVNRIILATDGDFNIGVSDKGELQRYIEGKRKTGIYLSILGVGIGNHNDRLMQALAQNGNGVAAYIDTLNEARKVLVDEASASLFPIARDVKIQIEFNPAQVSEYRLIGYETRALRREDFSNDKIDAGDVGSGHAVTAIYEVMPVGAGQKLVEGLRYQPTGRRAAEPAAKPAGEIGQELAFFKFRYKLPAEDESRLVTLPVGAPHAPLELADAPADVRFSIAVAAFGQLLKGSPHLGAYSIDNVIALADGAHGEDRFGLRAELVNLARMAKSAQR